ncbi:MAG: hypothetical protein ACTSU2_14770 [Promethearchaeota archaeon]
MNYVDRSSGICGDHKTWILLKTTWIVIPTLNVDLSERGIFRRKMWVKGSP